ncbi:hypothetical protein M011DRAFT_474415 [Sporormia fimetaria CBS 119925]|uniref:NTF2-like protein n=1 Tax=Sporormia fimetaria CBS 119925 TaxID=1340428 RepID=A0A6A6VMZ4_9PLEO|nr:hypothetical protein M011DRAFT_474415 [Sporormia fimetaria CBS 119925]
MSLSSKYEAFLANPSQDALAEDASLHYITTLTTLNSAAAIIKHFTVQEKLLKRKGNKLLHAVESSNAASLEIDATIEFVAGGGAYLPGLDDNFVADRTVTFPMVHLVQFDSNKKISQIRLYWDQGSLLKQIDVIGARARNWPIRDGKDQARLVAKSAASVAPADETTTSSRRSTTTSRGPDDVTITERPASSRSNASATRDPHASLNLFAPRDVEQETSSFAQPLAPRTQSAKPPSRNLVDIIAEDDQTPMATPSKERIPTKAGGGKNYKANRLFEEEEPVATPLSVKTNSKKYSHFEFGDGEDDTTPRGRKETKPTRTKHQSQWDFEDFVTPEKTKPKVQNQNVRHFGWSDDEEETSPVRRPVVHKARPDADAHFEFADEATPEASRHKHTTSKGNMHNKGLGLYQDHVLPGSDDNGDEASKGNTKRPLGDVTSVVRNENRQKDFGAHFAFTDDSPGPQKTASNGNAKMTENHKKVLKGLDAHWDMYDESPQGSKKETSVNDRPIKTSGNGMGGRLGTESSWTYGDASEDFPAPKPKSVQPSQKENVVKERGIKTGGNGMGGRLGTESSWTYGDDSEDVPTSKPKSTQASSNDKSFWDF